MEEDNELIFKAYSRSLLRNLNEVKKALKNKEYERAEELVDALIEDSQRNLED